MDNCFSRLPPVLLEDIHRRIVNAGGVRSAMAFESTCKDISVACRSIRLASVAINSHRNGIAQFERWNRAHGQRVDSMSLALNQLAPHCAPIRDLHIHAKDLQLTVHIASTLAPLASLPGLTGLCIERLMCAVNVKLCPLTTLAPTLRSLSLNISPGTVPSLQPLAALTALTSLELRNLFICRALTTLARLPPSLRRLHLANASHILDLEPLASCVGLTHLALDTFPALQSLAPIAALSDLRTLRLAAVASTTDLQPLCYALPALTSLELRSCVVLSLEHLATIAGGSLQALKLPECDCHDNLTPLAAMTGLRTLDLHSLRPPVRDLKSVAPLTTLRSLRLSCSRSLADLTPLRPLTALTHLELHGPRAATTLAPLASLTGLTALQLAHCRAPSLAPLTALTALQRLRCKSLRHVTSLEPLRKLPSLKNVRISDCPLVDPQAASLQHAFAHACSSR